MAKLSVLFFKKVKNTKYHSSFMFIVTISYTDVCCEEYALGIFGSFTSFVWLPIVYKYTEI
jgi:hypothetical protein